MPTYTIEGKRIKTDAPLSDADIDEIASSLKVKAPAPKPTVGESLAAAYKMGGPYAGVSSPGYRTVVGTGLTDPIVAVRELTGTISPEAVRQREVAYQEEAARSPGAGFGRFMGGAISTAPLALMPGAPAGANMLTRMAAGAGLGGGAAMLTQPTTGEGDFWAQKGQQGLMGGFVGGLAPVFAKGVELGARGVVGLRNRLSPEVNAQNILAQTLGNDPARLAQIRAANAAQPDVLASQAAAALPGTAQGYQSIVRRAEMEVPDVVAATRAAQTEGHLDTLRRLTGGATATEAQAAQKGTKETLGAVTAPMREEALTAVQRRADIVREAKQTGRQLLVPEVTGANLEIPKPLDIDALISKVEGAADAPAVRVSKVQSGVLKNVADLIRKEVERGDGVMDVNALYSIRKNAINEEVQRLLPNADAKAQQKYAAQLLSTLKPMIDDAIEKAGGRGWKNYLSTFEQGMTQANQQRLLGEAQELYRTNPNAFVDLVEGNNPKAVQDIFGTEFDIKSALGDKIKPLQKIADDVKREAAISSQAAGGATLASRALQENTLNARIPNFLSPKITVANEAIKGLEGKVNAKTLRVLAKAVQSGASMNELLSFVPPGEKSTVAAALRGVAQAIPMPYSINMLTPMSSRTPANQNALAGQ